MASITNSLKEHKTVIPVPLHHSVPIIYVGIVVSVENEDANQIGHSVCRIAPDRLHVVVLDPSSPASWPPLLHVLILCLSHPGTICCQAVNEYIHNNYKASDDTITAPIILTDFNLESITSDRRIFYDVLETFHHEIVSERLPIQAYANRDDYNHIKEHHQSLVRASSPTTITQHREHIQVNNMVLFKPCVERPADAANDDARVYYPASAGGGCKHLKTGRYFPDDNTVRGHDTLSSYVYEELAGQGDDDFTKEMDELTRVEKLRHWRRNRLKSFAFKVAPSIYDKEAIPDYADDDEVTYDSDLLRPDRKFFIVTTASLPWMTGTAINPLLRAAYLKKQMPCSDVTLVVPWLELPDDRLKVYGTKHGFQNPSEQEAHVRDWLRHKANLPEQADSLQILWYPGRYHGIMMSIFSTQDVCSLIPDKDADVCVLEEPEHLSWFRAEATPWTKKFNHVVGIVHTNYKAYVGIMAPFVSEMSTLVVRAYCHKLIKLSAVLQTFSPDKDVVSNVNGVRSEFIVEGERRGAALTKKETKHETGAEATQTATDAFTMWERCYGQKVWISFCIFRNTTRRLWETTLPLMFLEMDQSMRRSSERTLVEALPTLCFAFQKLSMSSEGLPSRLHSLDGEITLS